MTQVRAKFGFDHDGPRRRGAIFPVSKQVAEEMERRGLVEIVGEGPTPENPSTADGEPSSASPAAPVSPQATVPTSKHGGRKRKTEA